MSGRYLQIRHGNSFPYLTVVLLCLMAWVAFATGSVADMRHARVSAGFAASPPTALELSGHVPSILAEGADPACELSVTSVVGRNGHTVQVPVLFQSQGDIIGVGFSLNFDPTVLSNPTVVLGAGAAGGSPSINYSQVAAGRLGVAASLYPGNTFPAGLNEFALVTFTVADNPGVASTPVTFGNQPTVCEVVDANATVQPANWIDGSVTINMLPAPHDDTYATDEDVSLVVPAPGVLGNDADQEDDAFDISRFDQPEHGTVTLNPDGSLTYVPDAEWNGSDSFPYWLTDGTLESLAPGTVYITVTSINDPPVAQPESYIINEDTQLVIDAPGLLTNDTDVASEMQTLTAVLLDAAAHGVAAVNADGAFSYQPAHNFVGVDQFTYRAYDGESYSPATTVTITVNPMGYEADVSIRPDGNGVISLGDWTQVGRYVVGLDIPAPGSEFMRADCAPRDLVMDDGIMERGDGTLTIADWVQAGRYGVGLDPITPIGGPVGPAGAGAPQLQTAGNTPRPSREKPRKPHTERTVSLGTRTLARGQMGTVAILLNAQGDENAAGISLRFDPALLRFESAAVGREAAGATLLVNAARAEAGSIGCAVALPAHQTFASGRGEILMLTFSVISGNTTSTAITCDSEITVCQIVDPEARVLPAAFHGGTLLLKATPKSSR